MRESIEQHLILYVADELDADARADAEALIAADPEARAFVDELRAIQAHTATLLPDTFADKLPALEARIAHALRPVSTTPPVWKAWLWPEGGVWRVWTGRLALTALLVAVGFGLGRQGASPLALQEGVPPEALLVHEPQAEDSYFGGVLDMHVDPVGGQVEVRYQTVAERVVRGDPSDPTIKTLLEGALLDENNPAGRLDALRTLVSTAKRAPAPDHQIVDALVTVLQDEPNEGLRLQALRALGLLHTGHAFGELAKATVIDVMLQDANSALRIEALQLLTQNAAGTADLMPYLEAATADTNAFIQLKAERLLDRLPETNLNR
ncbi:MAG: hypothetical protein RhofKO_20080 [Rhodothermales bacterium]